VLRLKNGEDSTLSIHRISSTPACDSTLSSKIFVGAMRMDVSSIQAPLRMRVATENGEDSTLSIHRSQSAGGGNRRSEEREGPHSRENGNPLGWLARGRIASGRGLGRSGD